VTLFVVDASVVAKWFLPEQHSPDAQRLLTQRHDLVAPDLIHSEFTSILLKALRRRELQMDQARVAIFEMPTLVRAISIETMMNSTLDLALKYDRSAYDASYVALGLRERCQVVTADRKLYNALASTDLASTMLWIEDVPAVSE
jgi:predicted nucleic acid-binding protein